MYKKVPTSPAPYDGPVIRRASFIDDFGLERMVTANEIAKMDEKPKNLKCLCGQANVHFVGAHAVKGGIITSNYFKTNPKSKHAFNCAVLDRRTESKYMGSGADYDSRLPFRIHLNLPERQWRDVILGQGSFQMYNKDGSLMDTRYREWETKSVKSVEDLLKIMDKTNPQRLKKSLVVLNKRAIAWTSFCLSRNPESWEFFYDQTMKDYRILRLFLLEPKPTDLFSFQKTSDFSMPLNSIKLNKNISINVEASLSNETKSLRAKWGHVAVLGTGFVKQKYEDNVPVTALTVNATDPRYTTRFDYDSMLARAKERALAPKTAEIA